MDVCSLKGMSSFGPQFFFSKTKLITVPIMEINARLNVSESKASLKGPCLEIGIQAPLFSYYI